jgi:hypothetical protein
MTTERVAGDDDGTIAADLSFVIPEAAQRLSGTQYTPDCGIDRDDAVYWVARLRGR